MFIRKLRMLTFIAGFLIIVPSVFAEMYLDSNGNVGIRKTGPAGMLDVAGTIKGNLFEGDGSNLSNVPVSIHSHSGTDITIGTIDEAYIDPSVTRDSELASHSLRTDNPHSVTPAQIGAASSSHTHDTFYQQKYGGVAVVATSGGDYYDPYTAMNDISTWCGSPSELNPCLIRIMPGVYDLGTNILQMQEYVDIEGSGENTTKVIGNFGENSTSGVVSDYGAGFAEIRFLTVENVGGGGFAIAILLHNTNTKVTNVTAISSGANENLAIMCEGVVGCSSIITNVTAIASGGSITVGLYIDGNSSPSINNAKAITSDGFENIAVDINTEASPRMTNITAYASGGTKSRSFKINLGSTPRMMGVTAIASDASSENYAVWNINASSSVISSMTADAYGGTNNYGIYTQNYGSYSGGTIKVDHSIIRGTTNAIYTGATFTALFGNTRLSGSVTGTGTTTCAGVYDENYTFYASACP